MAFHLHQSGDVRRPSFQVSVSDFKVQASAGFSFWRGVLLGFVAGAVIAYWFGGAVARMLV